MLCVGMVKKIVSIIERNERGIIDLKIRWEWNVRCRNVECSFSGGCPGNVDEMVFPKNEKRRCFGQVPMTPF